MISKKYLNVELMNRYKYLVCIIILYIYDYNIKLGVYLFIIYNYKRIIHFPLIFLTPSPTKGTMMKRARVRRTMVMIILSFIFLLYMILSRSFAYFFMAVLFFLISSVFDYSLSTYSIFSTIFPIFSFI